MNLYRSRILVIGFVISLCAVNLAAAGLGTHDVFVPVVARTAGASGSDWQTDLVINNVSDRNRLARILITWNGTGGMISGSAVLDPNETLTIRDVVKNMFGLESGVGIIRVTTTLPETAVTARAKIVNRGSAHGEYGQAVPGVPTDALMRKHYLAGLSGVDGHRTNVGIANPWNVDAKVTLALYEASGNSRQSFTTIVPAHSVRQWNDIFYELGAEPLDGAMVRVTADFGVYAYASVVDNQSGDAIFIPGSGIATGNELLLPTQCPNPAPVGLTPPGEQPADGWIVMFRSDVDAQAKTAELASRYGFTPRTIYEAAFKGFAATFSQEVLAAIRCEAGVTVIYQNTQVPVD